MTTPHFSDDWEILSAYLDGQLSSREMDKVRQRLEAQPELQRALDELQRTRMVLRAAPRRRAPRNFTLSPEMVPQRKSWFGWTPVFSFASALAVVVLMVSFVITMLPGASPTSNMLAAAPLSPQTTTGAAATSAAGDQSITEPPIIAWGSGAGGFGGGPASAPPGAGGGSSESGPSIVSVPTQEPDATPPEPALVAPPLSASTPQDTLQATPEAPLRNAVPSLDSGPILGIRPTQDQGKIEITPESAHTLGYAAPGTAPMPGEEQTFLQRNLTAIQIGLGLLAVGFALAAILLRRRS